MLGGADGSDNDGSGEGVRVQVGGRMRRRGPTGTQQVGRSLHC